jgi:excisionase family DNA binding protein
MNGEQKVTASHRQRLAVVYLRQSSLAQVRDNTESTLRQYDLAETAIRLGWPSAQVKVIDADLGCSGRQAAPRAGLQELVGQVCIGEVGIILVLEVSRLARCSADFARLLELARLADTLLADADGVYDLQDFNDRLVLGIKSTISESELHLMAGRMHAARVSAAERGQLRCRLPIGYVYDDDGACVMDPDEQVRAAVTDVFATFRQVGSAFGVVEAFRRRPFPRRVFGRAYAGQLQWGRLTSSRVQRMVANPTYAGAYVYGRRVDSRQLQPDGTTRTVTTRRPRDQWPVLITDHHPAYLTWSTYLDNLQILAANHTAAHARPVRESPALCQGIIRCGSCGQAMQTRYHHRSHPHGTYACDRINSHQPTSTCRSIDAVWVDTMVARRLLAALTPAEITWTLAAADEVTSRAKRTVHAAELAVQRARYHAERAERAFHAVEPENRLVARTLETQWEARLSQLADAEATLADIRAGLPALPDRAALHHLAGDVQALWSAPTTTDRDRKRLLRTLIADVTILPEPDHTKISIGIRWHTGATERVTCSRPTGPRTPPTAMAMIRNLASTHTNRQIAEILNTAGHRSAHDQLFTPGMVHNLRRHYHLPTAQPFHENEITVAHAAAALQVSRGTLYYWIGQGQLPARRIGQHLAIEWTPNIEAECRHRAATSPHQNSKHQRRRAL